MAAANKIKKGLVHIYTGNGKGKTTAAFGLAIRAKGKGLDVCIVQFMKGKETNEVKSAKKLGIDVYQFGRDTFVDKKYPSQKDIDQAKDGLDFIKDSITKNLYDIIILDEINVAIDFNLLSVNEVLGIVVPRPAGLEMVLTGRNAHKDLIQIADYVTEMKEIKHPFAEKGIPAREGIEY